MLSNIQYAFLGHLHLLLHCQHIPISSFTWSKSHNLKTTRTVSDKGVGLSSAVFNICGQLSVNVSYNLRSETHCMQSVICSLQSVACSLQSAVCKCQTPLLNLVSSLWVQSESTVSLCSVISSFHFFIWQSSVVEGRPEPNLESETSVERPSRWLWRDFTGLSVSIDNYSRLLIAIESKINNLTFKEGDTYHYGRRKCSS